MAHFYADRQWHGQETHEGVIDIITLKVCLEIYELYSYVLD